MVKHKIGDLFLVTDFVANGSFASLKANVKYLSSPDYGVLIRLTDHTNNWSGNYIYVSEKSFQFLSKSTVYPGDLIINNVGDTGKAFLVPDLKKPMTLGPNSILVRPLDKSIVDTNYIFHFIKSPVGQGEIQRISSATTLKKFNKTAFRNIELNIPSLKEQVHIAETLSKTEALIKQRKESLRLLDEFLKSTFLEMFVNEKKIEEWGGVGKIKDLVENNKHSIKAGPFGSSLKKEFYVERGYKIYGQEQVIADDLSIGNYYINEELYKKLETCKIKGGDILISLVGTYGKVSIVPETFEPGIINPRLMKISLDRNRVNPTYFKFLLQSTFILSQTQRISRGGTMDILNVGIVKELLVPKPPIEFQNRFARIVNAAERLKTQYQTSLQQLDDLYASLSQRAFNGKLRFKSDSKVIHLRTDEKEEDYFKKRKALACYIINQSLDDEKFGDTKFEKLLFLSDYAAVKRNFGQRYYQKVAGPYDNTFTNTFYIQIGNSKLFKRRKGNGQTIFLAGANHIKSFTANDYFSEEELQRVNNLIKIFKKSDYEQPEIIATLYAVWNNRIIRQQEVTDELLKADFLQWDTKKTKYRARLDAALGWMREEGIVPDGWGKLIEKSKSRS